tara:strand:+ start:67 stop:858 length:792 start_codon:yes stop_codon:yes gene_type:complete
MRTEILANGEALRIADAHGTVVDDFGYSWVSVKGSQKSWHFRVPPNMRHTQKDYDEALAEVKYKSQMSQWHIDTQNMLQKLWPKGIKEYSIDGTRRADFLSTEGVYYHSIYQEEKRIFEAQYSDMPDDEPYERTKYWSEQGYMVTWILAPHILDEVKYHPNHVWHGESFSTTNFPTKNLNKWLAPLLFPGTTILTTLPLFEWGFNVRVRKDARDERDREGQPCIYRFYEASYSERYKNWTVYGGCTFDWKEGLKKSRPGKRMY